MLLSNRLGYVLIFSHTSEIPKNHAEISSICDQLIHFHPQICCYSYFDSRALGFRAAIDGVTPGTNLRNHNYKGMPLDFEIIGQAALPLSDLGLDG